MVDFASEVAMQRSASVIWSIVAVAAGCVLNNPNYGDGDASATATTSTSTSTSTTQAASAASTAPTMTGASASETTAGVSEGATTTSTSTSTSGTEGETTEGTSTSGGAVDPCPPGEAPIVVELATAAADTMVVKPGEGGVCAWNPACATLNYGAAGYVDMFHDPLDGRSLFLVRFDLEDYDELLADAGDFVPEDVLAYHLQIVFWQNSGAPDTERRFIVAAIHPDNAGWRAGAGAGTPAAEGESSFACRSIVAGACEGWSESFEGPLAGAMMLATLDITADAVVAGEEDVLDMEYHAHVPSSRIPAEDLAGWIGQPTNPGLIVFLQDPKDLDVPLSLGLKPMEPGWSDPTLLVEVCAPMEGESDGGGGGGGGGGGIDLTTG